MLAVPTIGILGGMGPMATVDFMQKIVTQTPAQCDQDHVPLLVYSMPQVPDRTACLLDNTPSPLAAMEKGVRVLTDAGVGCIAIPCNTAHYWQPDLVKITTVPIFHIAKICAGYLLQQGVTSVALLATAGTLKAGIYSTYLRVAGIDLILPPPEVQEKVMAGIYSVKAGNVTGGAKVLEACAIAMRESGADKVILGCTEIPLALDHIQSKCRDYSVDATGLLARACIDWYWPKKSTSALCA